MQIYNKIQTISRTITSVDESNIIVLFDNSALPDPTRISLNGFVKNLKAFSKISSLVSVNLPVFELEDSESQKLFKTLDIEFNSPRKQLDLFIGDATNWGQVGSISLLNPSGYPYRMYNLLDFYTDGLAAELGENGKIGVQVVDVGHGLLVGADTITIHGSYVQEYVKDAQNAAILSTSIFTPPDIFATNEEITLLEANSNRVGLTIWNDSTTNLLLDFDNIPNNGYGIRISPDAYYELPFGYTGIIRGFWEGANPSGQAIIKEFLR